MSEQDPAKILKRWADDGTLRRVSDATDNRTSIRIRRSSGEWQTGIIASCCGFGGLLCVVAWGDNLDAITYRSDRVLFPPGVKGKHAETADVIAWNPWLAGESRDGASC